VSQREDAEDIACEVFVAVPQSLSSFRGEASLFTWLVGIARRKIADHLRRVGRRREVRESELPLDQPSPFEDVEWTDDLPDDFLQREEVAHAVRHAVAQLPDAQREALLLRHVEGLTIQDISHTLGRSEDSIKALLRRAKATLLHLLNSPDESGRPTSQRGENHEQIPSTLQSVALESSPRE
jgi:RNA polymerase sigma-70 factor (ECF subfamily)